MTDTKITLEDAMRPLTRSEAEVVHKALDERDELIEHDRVVLLLKNERITKLQEEVEGLGISLLRTVQERDKRIRRLEKLMAGRDVLFNRRCEARDQRIAERDERIKKLMRVLGEAREMLSVFEDHGGHDGLEGRGYRCVLDHIDACRPK